MSIANTNFSTYQGDVTEIEYLDHIPPDVKSQSFWLRNRQSDMWKEISATNSDSDEGGSFSIVINHTLHPDDRTLLDEASPLKLLNSL